MDGNFEKRPNNEKTRLEKAEQKYKTFSMFSFTAQDHRDLLGTPPAIFTAENEGKAEYELLTLEQIEQRLDDALEGLEIIGFSDDGRERALLNILEQGIPFLESVGKLPEKYKNFDTSNL